MHKELPRVEVLTVCDQHFMYKSLCPKLPQICYFAYHAVVPMLLLVQPCFSDISIDVKRQYFCTCFGLNYNH
jgi:hypothetical protein